MDVCEAIGHEWMGKGGGGEGGGLGGVVGGVAWRGG